ncbi:hypothetical protein [Pseudonocardia sp. TRM90224]|uniref:hypothetical protein n=1 Tax=Pseudonocardia sp. TRM90224 TaxID=2812678 RepID=UPI001E303F7E|nr:hypothetical protein [Pseudonocardia sp. TRM90224]
MSIDSTDLTDAARTISEAIEKGLGGYQAAELHSEYGEGRSVAGGLFAVARAINHLADVIEMGQSE